MLSRDLLRRETERLAEAVAVRGTDPALVVRWRELDEERRKRLVEVEALKQKRKVASREIGALKQEGGDASEQIEAMGHLKATIESHEQELARLEEELRSCELTLPNVAHDSVPEGEDESANRVDRKVGERPEFDFEPAAHWDLGPALGLLDFERGAKLAGARFTTYFGLGARLERALAAFMLDLHTGSHGYVEVLPPYLVLEEAMLGSGQLPKFAAEAFRTEGNGHYLIPTAEVPLVNLHRDEILEESELPVRYTAHTPCFRAEAGSYGKDVRGLIRQHQFNKVELVQLVAPERSYDALAELTGHAETVLQRLEIPYRVVSLSTGDMGFAAAKTLDLEAWLPGQSAYREISSCSNCEAFQARRANLRYRPVGGGKPRHLHTLNGSALAVGRTLIAVLENYQQADGSVRVPEVLRPYLGGLEVIDAR